MDENLIYDKVSSFKLKEKSLPRALSVLAYCEWKHWGNELHTPVSSWDGNQVSEI